MKSGNFDVLRTIILLFRKTITHNLGEQNSGNFKGSNNNYITFQNKKTYKCSN